MFDPEKMPIYLAIGDRSIRSRAEDLLVLDGFSVGTFETARTLWQRFKVTPARLIITDRRFPDGFGALELARAIRAEYLLPYVYIVALSTLSNRKQIREGLEAGVDDYLIKPPNPLQWRTRVLVAQRWLNYLDSISGPQR